MARSSKRIRPGFGEIIRVCWPGIVSSLFLILIIGGTFSALLSTSSSTKIIDDFGNSTYLRKVLVFTLWQAGLSTLISVGIGVLVARAFARQQSLTGRRLILQLLGLPIVTPVIVAVLGITAVYGQSGILRENLQLLGFSWPGNFYGLPGILVAHVFFNLPLSIRMLLPAWDRIPSENWRLAAHLGMNSRQLFLWLEWPALTSVLAGTAGIVFLLCFSSFAVVLVLGGGPSTTTIEVAIYQALRFDFDPSRAASLAIVQLTICTIVILSLHRWMRVQPISSGLATTSRYRPDEKLWKYRCLDFFLIALTTSFVALPLLAIVYAGITGPLTHVLLDSRLWAAAGRSAGIALAAATTALTLAMGLLFTSRVLLFQFRNRSSSSALQILGSITFAVPPMVIGTGLFIILLPMGVVFDAAVLVIILVNAILVLPYIMRTVGPALLDAGHRYDRLCHQLDLKGWNRLRFVEWPVIRQPLGFSMALCATLSIGDMGVAALFDTSGVITLPVLLYHRFGAYRFDEAAVTALVLIILCALVFLIVDRGIGKWRS
jgi:thiamine transport system permease protein